MANNRPIDRTKKSNIKCEHCKYWEFSCENSKSPRFMESMNYWNRCKAFEWKAEVKEVR